MNGRILAVWIICCLVGAQDLSAQVLDTVFPSTSKSRYLRSEQLFDLDSTTTLEDTLQEFGHRIHPLVDKEVGFLDLGYIGTPAEVFRLTQSPMVGFDAGVHGMDQLFFHADSTKYFKGSTPRTFLKYGQGNEELIYLIAEHSQNIFERWSFGIDYRRIKTQNWHYDNINDFILRRIPNNYNTRFYTRFYTENQKYEVVASYNRNTATIAETGGMVDLAKYDTLDRREKQYFNSVFLSNAENRYRTNEIQVLQFFRFGSTSIEIVENKDTIGVMDTIEHFTPKGHFYHEIRHFGQQYRFRDENPNMSYYPERILGLATLDSFHVQRLSNTFGLFFLPSEKLPRLEAALQHDWIRTDQSGFNVRSFQQLWLKGKITQPIGKSELRAFAQTGLYGYNAGDLHVTGKMRLVGKDSTKGRFLLLSGVVGRYEASFQQQYFVSNHYYWLNEFEKQGYIGISGEAGLAPGLNVSMAVEQFANPVVYGVDGTPEQRGDAQIVSVQLKNTLHFWRFTLQSNGLVKLVSENSPIRYPLVTVKESFYYEGDFFKQNLRARIGIDMFYYSAYNANYYNPATRQYQLNDALTIGNYPMFDLFITGKIRTVDIFVAYRHASEGLFGNSYYASTRYPQIPSSARIGLSWRLFN